MRRDDGASGEGSAGRCHGRAGFQTEWISWARGRALERLPKRAYTPPVKLSRFELIITLALGFLMLSLVAEAQQTGRVTRFGWLLPDAPPPPAFWQRMRHLGVREHAVTVALG